MGTPEKVIWAVKVLAPACWQVKLTGTVTAAFRARLQGEMGQPLRGPILGSGVTDGDRACPRLRLGTLDALGPWCPAA